MCIRDSQMDLWLDTQGYYRKHIGRDGTSLFRAVSEQVCLFYFYSSIKYFEHYLMIIFDNLSNVIYTCWNDNVFVTV